MLLSPCCRQQGHDSATKRSTKGRLRKWKGREAFNVHRVTLFARRREYYYWSMISPSLVTASSRLLINAGLRCATCLGNTCTIAFFCSSGAAPLLTIQRQQYTLPLTHRCLRHAGFFLRRQRECSLTQWIGRCGTAGYALHRLSPAAFILYHFTRFQGVVVSIQFRLLSVHALLRFTISVCAFTSASGNAFALCC